MFGLGAGFPGQLAFPSERRLVHCNGNARKTVSQSSFTSYFITNTYSSICRSGRPRRLVAMLHALDMKRRADTSLMADLDVSGIIPSTPRRRRSFSQAAASRSSKRMIGAVRLQIHRNANCQTANGIFFRRSRLDPTVCRR
jgi:hypothetical protein